ncbi:hypothetical protein JCM5353_005870 [Sporobolomyces roseus]
MPLYYALPLAFGLTGAIAITLILIEVVPKVLEERERRKSREGRAAVATRRKEVPVQAKGSAREGNGWGYEIRQRKGKAKMRKDQRVDKDEAQSLLRPIKTEREDEGARYVLSNPSDVELSSPDVERRPIKSSTYKPLRPIHETITTTTAPPATEPAKPSQTRSKSDLKNSSSPSLISALPTSEQPWCPTAFDLLDVDRTDRQPDQTSNDRKPSELESHHSSSFSSPILLPTTSTSTSAFNSPSLSHTTDPDWIFDHSITSSPSKRDPKKLESESGSDAGWFRLSDDDDDDDDQRGGEGDAREIAGSREVEEGAMREWEKVGKETGVEKGLL